MNTDVSRRPAAGVAPSERPKIVGGVGGESRQVVAQPGISLRPVQARQELRFGQPTPTLRLNRAEHGDGPTLDGHCDVFSGLDAAKHSRRVVAQVTGRNFRHATNVLRT